MDTVAIIALGIFFALILVVVLTFFASRFQRITVFEFQEGLKYRDGKFQRALGPGRHWIYPSRSHVIIMDLRPYTISLDGMQILTRDSVPLGASVTSGVKVADSLAAFSASENWVQTATSLLQGAVRKHLNLSTATEVASDRQGLATRVMSEVAAKGNSLGFTYMSLEFVELSVAENPLRGRPGFRHETDQP
ncbi:MAG: SPFH domain-containing protein [Terriglobales bacterium]